MIEVIRCSFVRDPERMCKLTVLRLLQVAMMTVTVVTSLYRFFILEGYHISKSVSFCCLRLKTEVQKPQEGFLIGFIGASIWGQSSRWEASPTSSRMWVL